MLRLSGLEVELGGMGVWDVEVGGIEVGGGVELVVDVDDDDDSEETDDDEETNESGLAWQHTSIGKENQERQDDSYPTPPSTPRAVTATSATTPGEGKTFVYTSWLAKRQVSVVQGRDRNSAGGKARDYSCLNPCLLCRLLPFSRRSRRRYYVSSITNEFSTCLDHLPLNEKEKLHLPIGRLDDDDIVQGASLLREDQEFK